MIKRMPTTIDGRPVHLKTVEGDIDPKSISQSAWEVICAHTTIGIWHRIKGTETLGYGPLHKAYEALYMRCYTRGLDSILTVKSTECDGICFCWLADVKAPEAQQRMVALRNTRLKKKLKLNKSRLKRIKALDSQE